MTTEKKNTTSESEREETKKSVDFLKIVNALISAAIIALVTFVIVLGNRVTKIESRMVEKDEMNELKVEIARLEEKINHSSQIAVDTSNFDPLEALKKIIIEEQDKYVQEFTGTEDYQAFTDKELEEFNNSNTIATIKSELKTRPDFIRIVEAAHDMKNSDWLVLKDFGLKEYGPTGLGKPRGQTIAGQKAQKSIAEAIVELLEKMR